MPENPEEIIHRTLDTDRDEPAVQVVETIAEIEGTDPTEFADMYGCIDGVLDHVFSNPPAPEAQLRVEFNYEGYRVTLEQDGLMKLVKLDG